MKNNFINILRKIFKMDSNNQNQYSASFWFMTDGHGFIKPKGKNIDKVKKSLLEIAKTNPYGMVCPVIILENGKELKRIGKCCHVDNNGNVNLDDWLNTIQAKDNQIYFSQID